MDYSKNYPNELSNISTEKLCRDIAIPLQKLSFCIFFSENSSNFQPIYI